MSLGQQLCGIVWEFSWLHWRERSGLFGHVEHSKATDVWAPRIMQRHLSLLCYVIWLFVKRLSQEAIQRRSQR